MASRESLFISLFLKTIVPTLKSVIIFTGHTFRNARVAHKRHQGCIYSYHWVQNSYQLFKKPRFDTNVVCYYFYIHPFQPSSISLLRLGNIFSISSPFGVTKLQKNCLDVSSTGRFPFPMSMHMHIVIPYQPYRNEDSTWI
jgi:hypothetical protein